MRAHNEDNRTSTARDKPGAGGDFSEVFFPIHPLDNVECARKFKHRAQLMFRCMETLYVNWVFRLGGVDDRGAVILTEIPDPPAPETRFEIKEAGYYVSAWIAAMPMHTEAWPAGTLAVLTLHQHCSERTGQVSSSATGPRAAGRAVALILLKSR
eukprot:355400-Chlamydomonas_euryale.AAC.7